MKNQRYLFDLPDDLSPETGSTKCPYGTQGYGSATDHQHRSIPTRPHAEHGVHAHGQWLDEHLDLVVHRVVYR